MLRNKIGVLAVDGKARAKKLARTPCERVRASDVSEYNVPLLAPLCCYAERWAQKNTLGYGARLPLLARCSYAFCKKLA